jgi:hypothetical protein
MTKVTIEVDFEDLHNTLSNVLDYLRAFGSLPADAIKPLEQLHGRLFVARDALISKNEWRPLKAGYRTVEWFREYRKGWEQRKEFKGVEVNVLGEIRIPGSTLVPPTVQWDGDPMKPLTEYRPDEKFPEGRVAFQYEGRIWYFLIKKYGPLDEPKFWIITEEYYNKKGVDRILSIFE